MNGIIEGKPIEKTIPDIITKDFVIFTTVNSDGNWCNFYKSSYPNDYYVLCIAPQSMSGLLTNERPNAYGLYHINKGNKTIKTIWYDVNNDYSVSQYSPSRYSLLVKEDEGRIYAYWYSESGRQGNQDSIVIGFPN